MSAESPSGSDWASNALSDKPPGLMLTITSVPPIKVTSSMVATQNGVMPLPVG